MSIIAKVTGEKFPLPDEGTIQAVCVGIWDIGEQITPFVDEQTGLPKTQHKVVIAWEINQMIDAPGSEYHGKPYMLSKIYTLSLNEKSNLRHDLESWRGKPFTEDELRDGFDLEELYGVNCLVGVTHVTKNDRTFARITSILPLIKDMEEMIPVRAKDAPPPKWVLEKMQQAPRPVNLPALSTDDSDDDDGYGENVPF